MHYSVSVSDTRVLRDYSGTCDTWFVKEYEMYVQYTARINPGALKKKKKKELYKTFSVVNRLLPSSWKRKEVDRKKKKKTKQLKDTNTWKSNKRQRTKLWRIRFTEHNAQRNHGPKQLRHHHTNFCSRIHTKYYRRLKIQQNWRFNNKTIIPWSSSDVSRCTYWSSENYGRSWILKPFVFFFCWMFLKHKGRSDVLKRKRRKLKETEESVWGNDADGVSFDLSDQLLIFINIVHRAMIWRCFGKAGNGEIRRVKDAWESSRTTWG